MHNEYGADPAEPEHVQVREDVRVTLLERDSRLARAGVLEWSRSI